MTALKLAAGLALSGTILIVTAVAIYDWRWAIGVAGALLIVVALMLDEQGRGPE